MSPRQELADDRSFATLGERRVASPASAGIAGWSETLGPHAAGKGVVGPPRKGSMETGDTKKEVSSRAIADSASFR